MEYQRPNSTGSCVFVCVCEFMHMSGIADGKHNIYESLKLKIDQIWPEHIQMVKVWLERFDACLHQ